MTHRFFVEEETVNGCLRLSDEDRRRVTSVLRLRPGDSVVVCNGQEGSAVTEGFHSAFDKYALARRKPVRVSRRFPGPECGIFDA